MKSKTTIDIRQKAFITEPSMEEMLKKHSLLPGLQPQTRQKTCPEELMVYPRKAETENNLKESQAKLKGTSDKCYCFLSACCLPGTESCLLYALTRNLSVAREAELFLSPFHRLQKLRLRELESGSSGTRSGFCSVGDPEFFLGLYSFLGMGSRCRWQMLLSVYSNLIPFTGQ